jgi:hypothetical protein
MYEHTHRHPANAQRCQAYSHIDIVHVYLRTQLWLTRYSEIKLEICENVRSWIYIHTTHALSPKEYQKHLGYSSQLPTFYQIYLAMRNIANVTDGQPIAVRSQFISGVNAVNALVAFYDIHGRKRVVLFFYSVPITTQDLFEDLTRRFLG